MCAMNTLARHYVALRRLMNALRMHLFYAYLRIFCHPCSCVFSSFALKSFSSGFFFALSVIYINNDLFYMFVVFELCHTVVSMDRNRFALTCAFTFSYKTMEKIVLSNSNGNNNTTSNHISFDLLIIYI